MDSFFVTKNAILIWQWVVCVDVERTENTTPITGHIISNAYNLNEIRDNCLLNLWFQLFHHLNVRHIVTGFMSTKLLDFWLFYWKYGWKYCQWLYWSLCLASVIRWIGWTGHLSTFNFKLAFNFSRNIQLVHFIYLFVI